MSYELEFDYSPVYELFISLSAYLTKKDHKSMDSGKKWVDSVNSSLEKSFKNQLSKLKPDTLDGIEQLIYYSPQKNTVNQFLKWAEALNEEDFISITEPHDKFSVSQLTEWIAILTEWNRQYFQSISPKITEGLESKYNEIKELSTDKSPEKVMEEATNGMRYSTDTEVKKFILIPQYHLSPINRSVYYKNNPSMVICFFAYDPMPSPEGVPSTSLMRMTRCLSDESRMTLLYSIAQQNRTFNELVELSGLAKSTVHHHLIALRGAGFIGLEVKNKTNSYFFRPNSLTAIDTKLKAFFRI